MIPIPGRSFLFLFLPIFELICLRIFLMRAVTMNHRYTMKGHEESGRGIALPPFKQLLQSYLVEDLYE